MHVEGESDGRVLPTKRPNNGGKPLAEGVEGRRPTKENIEQTTALRTQSRASATSGLLGVREVARNDKRIQFTALLHHATVALLWDSFHALKRDAAPGVDAVTWKGIRNGPRRAAAGSTQPRARRDVSCAAFEESLHPQG
jgi:hypothetical protein